MALYTSEKLYSLSYAFYAAKNQPIDRQSEPLEILQPLIFYDPAAYPYEGGHIAQKIRRLLFDMPFALLDDICPLCSK